MLLSPHAYSQRMPIPIFVYVVELRTGVRRSSTQSLPDSQSPYIGMLNKEMYTIDRDLLRYDSVEFLCSTSSGEFERCYFGSIRLYPIINHRHNELVML